MDWKRYGRKWLSPELRSCLGIDHELRIDVFTLKISNVIGPFLAIKMEGVHSVKLK
jgi:hypothetical protein